MNKALFKEAYEIINHSIEEVLPNIAIQNALKNFSKPKGNTIMIAIGKAAYEMAKKTTSLIHVDKGLVITKYNHSKNPIENVEIIEAGHPILDSNSIKAANKAIELCSHLNKDDVVIMLISGGGSSLFESPLIDIEELQDINKQLIKCGASINEINTIRKRLSKVKGGKFAKICEPAKVFNIVLSDIINDPLDMIASGPTHPDNSSASDAINIINKYKLTIKENTRKLLEQETIKELTNTETYIIGNNDKLKQAAKQKAKELGYKVIYIDKPITSNIVDAKKLFIDQINKYKNNNENICIIGGGEITVEVKGDGLGGRNQELACQMASHIKEENICFFSIGSDGTDGPTDAAGGYVDKDSYNIELESYLQNNDTYHYLEKYGGLIKTGPTGTNVCDLYCVLIKNKTE